ncbi:NADH-Ubiquinone/plastoquinone (complex I), various chains family protein [Mycobacterium xenopi 4042]|uniref:NADH-Ubiquinone/plastoquinone (Complex I), various chains family protein n=1 Tax=Mycobacterium xenopi 4042 TaxID=1299334 RepID=X8AAL2_MYCXE|nr:NADH-Ubiquinone/plastoquinone (complex I), various chains family protein [Mycobacterium xenopi 4042]
MDQRHRRHGASRCHPGGNHRDDGARSERVRRHVRHRYQHRSGPDRCCDRALLVLAVAGDEIRGSPRESETYALLLFSTTGVLILAGADDLLVLITGFLLTSIPLYGLIGLLRSPTAAEATMKAYLIGALFGIVLMLGVSILYAVTGATSYHELGFRLGNAPAGAVAAGQSPSSPP